MGPNGGLGGGEEEWEDGAKNTVVAPSRSPSLVVWEEAREWAREGVREDKDSVSVKGEETLEMTWVGASGVCVRDVKESFIVVDMLPSSVSGISLTLRLIPMPGAVRWTSFRHSSTGPGLRPSSSMESSSPAGVLFLGLAPLGPESPSPDPLVDDTGTGPPRRA